MASLLRPCRLTGAALLAALLVACGGGTQEDPWTSFAQQKLDWQACDPTLLGEGDNALTQLGERAQCALMRAPLDYSHPGLGELQVAVLRVAAEQPQQRAGAILFNPGGPGADGLGFAALHGALWRYANPDSPTGKLLQQLANRYDMIGFSPRGVGASSSLTCYSPELKEVQFSLTFDRSPQNLANALRNARLEAQACRKNPLSKHIHTDATARDMDLLRSLLGDARLHYIGYSYGTWLGAWYASLFPERVGRMLLDSSMDVTASLDDATLLQEMGRQRVIDEVVLPYAARHPELFNQGSSAGALRDALLALSPQVKSVLFSAINVNDPAEIRNNGFLLNAAIQLQALRQQNPTADEDQLHAAIAAHAFIPTETENAATAMAAHRLADGLFASSTRESTLLLPPTAVNVSVRCNDLATRGNEQHWIDVGNDYAARYPFSGGAATENPCLYWGAPVKPRPPLAAAGTAGPLLLLQSRFDALTPVESAQANLNSLPNASLIVVENEYKHGLFPYGQACVDEKVADYFLHGTVPARMSICAGKPLAGDAGPASRQLRTLAASADEDSAQAEDLMARIHRKIGKAARQGF
ncbi:alpha/beta hydrolase [Pantoea sp. 18069]|uniref:alpha/beta hydrolase n=1 Tax=Pantoea sp. 18069 TaxID=2681415 RepID=UPI001359EFF8|nr:alpha/beta hydrolase [Pantoea sp. 18069]